MTAFAPVLEPSPVLQRSAGAARVVMGTRSDGRTVLRDLLQQGCSKAMLPRTHSAHPEIVFLNTAGGITGGDRLSYSVTLEDGARATAATQTAERAYRSAGDAGEMRVALELGAGARLDWLPQETILFEGSRTQRRTQVHMAADATLLWCETIVLGRSAMGETLSDFYVRDDRRVLRGGRLILWEPMQIGAAHLAQPSCLDGARAVSTVAYLAPDAEDAINAVRNLEVDGADLASSAWDGKLLVRVAAQEAYPLRCALAQVLTALRDGAALPRVWQL